MQMNLETPLWRWVDDLMHRVVHRYGYQEIRLPILEPAELFATARTAQQVFGSGSEVLRPEGFPGCIKAVIKGDEPGRQDVHRCWYQGPMFRQSAEGPRQYHQLDVEAFGMAGAEIDAELILLTRDMFAALGLGCKARLVINNLGT